jgi:hypothetical protein
VEWRLTCSAELGLKHACMFMAVGLYVAVLHLHGMTQVVRAARDLQAGDELQDTYLGDVLTQPLQV